jgi:D-3-phosphoglycerate dehydrogenase
MNYKVVITDLEHPTIAPELDVLASINAEVERHDCRTEDDVIQVGAGADALMVGFAPITGRVLGVLPQCSIVARYGIGVEMIDLEAATHHGVVVTNVPDFCLNEVADHAMALLLASARKIVYLDRAVREGRAAAGGYWKTASIAEPMYRLSKQTLGIIGLGRTGQGVARRAQAFGMRVIAAPDPAVDPEEAAARGVAVLPIDEVFRQADFLSLHVPLTPETRHLVNAEALALMKPNATIVNTSRGPVIDETALIQALRDQRLASVALDVYEQEPITADNPLIEMENVVLCSHAAWYSVDAFYEMKTKTAQAVVDYFQGRAPRYILNPSVLSSPSRREPPAR